MKSTLVPGDEVRKSGDNSAMIFSLVLVTIALVAFWGSQYNGFVNLDDHDYITRNSHVNSGLTLDNLAWAFTSYHSFNWHPLTWLSHMFDVEMFGLNPAGHHWNSLLLHMANTLLLFFLLRSMTGASWRSAAVAALFAIHPLHVESVAWASERKDVLSGFFWMTAMLAYVRYVRRPGWWPFSTAVVMFSFGLMSKPIVVTLPFVLLLLDFWPLQRFPSTRSQGYERWAVFLRLCREKIPFFALSALSSVLTYFVQRESGAVTMELSLGARVSNALVSYVRYIMKMGWPIDLASFYPHPVDSLKNWQILGSLLLLILITFILVRFKRNHPYLIVGWLWYLGTLVPVIGLVQVGAQAMADRYTYLPLIGLFLMIVWAIPQLARGTRLARASLGGCSAVALALLLLLTTRQVTYWRDTLSLYHHEVEVQKDSFMAHFHLGTALEEVGRVDEASARYTEAVRMRPGFQLGHYHLANAYARLGRPVDALHHFSISIALDPNDYRSLTNMGVLLLKEGRTGEAVSNFSEALRINPGDQKAQYNLDRALQKARESANP
jgi:protein O-mannosyl-transferase